jgi:hypothetical protein
MGAVVRFLIEQANVFWLFRIIRLCLSSLLKLAPDRLRRIKDSSYFWRLVGPKDLKIELPRLRLAAWQKSCIEGVILLYLALLPVWRCEPFWLYGLICLLYLGRLEGYSNYPGWELPVGGLVLALATFLAGNGRQSAEPLWEYEAGFCLAWLIGWGFSPRFSRKVLDWLLLSSVIWMAIGLRQQLCGIPTSPGWLGTEQTVRIAVRSYAVFSNPNIYALYLVSIVGMALGWSRFAPQAVQRIGYRLILVLALVSLYFTYSRNGWLVAAGLCLWRMCRGKNYRLMGLLYGAIGAFLLTWGGFQTRLFSALAGRDSSFAYRWQIWRSVGRLLRDNWLWGIGPGNFSQVYPFLQPAPPFCWHAHSVYLQLWLEFGVMPLLLVLVWGGRLLTRELRLAGEPERQAVALGILALASGGFAESWQASRFCREYGGLLVGMLLALRHKEQGSDD